MSRVKLSVVFANPDPICVKNTFTFCGVVTIHARMPFPPRMK